MVWCVCVRVSVYRKIANAQFDPAKLPSTVDETIEEQNFEKQIVPNPIEKGTGEKGRKKQEMYMMPSAHRKATPPGFAAYDTSHDPLEPATVVL